MNVSVHGAKTQLSKLLDLVEDGEPVVIERHGRPVAQRRSCRHSIGQGSCCSGSSSAPSRWDFWSAFCSPAGRRK